MYVGMREILVNVNIRMLQILQNILTAISSLNFNIFKFVVFKIFDLKGLEKHGSRSQLQTSSSFITLSFHPTEKKTK